MAYVEVGAWSDIAPPTGAVVVGYNGKEHSRAALTWAAREAVATDAPLLVLYAADYPGMTRAEGSGMPEREPGALEAAEEVTAQGVREAVEMHLSLRVVGATEVISPTQALVEASRTASLVVLGNRGHGRVLAALLGSVAFNVAARAECPVVVVRDGTADRVVGPDHRVVVGTDGSPQARAAVDFAAARAATASAELTVVACTGEDGESVSSTWLREIAAQVAAGAIERAQAAHPGLRVTSRIEDGSAERALVACSADAGLVVLGTRGRGAFEGMLLGSVSHAVIHGAECAVAVVEDLSG
jgi:nucleotide-binding universal stress UspA family protein